MSWAGRLALSREAVARALASGEKTRELWDLMLMWAKKMAYAKQDADTLDLARSQSFEAEYKRYMPDVRSNIDRLRRNNAIMKPR